MFNQEAAQFSRLKILYARVTLTRFTTLYFFLAVFTCVALSALQIFTFTINSNAASLLNPVDDIPKFGIPIVDRGRLKLCPNLPSEGTKSCMQVIDFGTNKVNRSLVLQGLSTASNLSSTCFVSLRYLDEMLQDSQREDIVTLIFNLYLFVMAVSTVVSESIPHLVAALLGHLLGAAWAIYRLRSTIILVHRYKNSIVPLACDGMNFLRGSSWTRIIGANVPLLVIHLITLAAFSYLSLTLFRVYRIQTLSRVGAAPRIFQMYKITLVFLVCLQLAGFFCLTSAVLWLNKISRGVIIEFSGYITLYRVAFIVNIVIYLPWLVLGWISVRRESRILFAICILIAVVLIVISTALFCSPIYRYIFLTWPFFTTVTCTAYALLIATSIFCVICRLNFGKGLADYLTVTRALASVDFTPVCFPKTEEMPDEKDPFPNFTDRKTVRFLDLPSPAYQGYSAKAARSSWTFSSKNKFTVQVSTTPALLSEAGPLSPRKRRQSRKA